MTSPTSDLWSAWRTRRDERAFETLVVPEMPHALGYARRLGCGETDAEDALQEALVRLAGVRDDAPSRFGVRAWLCREVQNRTRSRRRSEKRRRAREAVAARDEATAPERPALDVREEVERALASLDESDREAVTLRHLHDLDYREIAYVLGASEGACRLRVHRAVAALRARLGRDAPAAFAVLALPTVRDASLLCKAALAKAAVAKAAATTGGLIAMTTAQKIAAAAFVAALAGVGGTLAAQRATKDAPPPAAPAVVGTPPAPRREDAPRPRAAPPVDATARELAAELDPTPEEIEFLRATLTKRRASAATAAADLEAQKKAAASAAAGLEAQSRAAARAAAVAKLSDEWAKDVLQIQDAGKRATALVAIRDAVAGGDETRCEAALLAVSRIGSVEYDKAALRPSIRALFGSPLATTRHAAAYALFNAGGAEAGDLELVIPFADDPDSSVRRSATHLIHLFGKGDVSGVAAQKVLALLNSSDAATVRETMRGLWGAAVTPEIATRLVEISHDPALRADAIWLAVSTVRRKPQSIVDELVRALEDPDARTHDRALWGLGYDVAPEAAPTAAAAMARLLESRADPQTQQDCLRYLTQIGTSAELPVLERMSANSLATESVRSAARRAVVAIQSRR